MSYIIGSFNVLKLSNETHEEIRKDYDLLARIISNEGFDVIALQEVLSENPIRDFLLPALGPQKWDYVWDAPKMFSTGSQEGYAFLWNKRRLRLVEAEDNPKIYNRYRIRGSRASGTVKNLIGAKGLIRPPFVARFTPAGLLGGSNFEIRLVNTHIIFEKPKNADDFMISSDLSDVRIRRQELSTLSEEIYRMVSTKQYGDNMPSYTFLLGDYNLCLCGSESKMDEFIKIDNTRILRTVQKEKTSLKQPQRDDNGNAIPLDDYYAHNYDHFSYETDLDDKLKLKVSRVDALAQYCSNDLKIYRQKVSDHVPIKLTLNLTLREGLRSYGG